MKSDLLKKISSATFNNRDAKIRIAISESERIAEEERINRIKTKPLTREEKIINFHSSLN